jgi:tetratricopeptide (TPR) repeat protein
MLAPSDILSSIKLENDSTNKPNRLCFVSERLNLLKNFSESLESLKQAIELDPNNSTALHQLGAMMNEQKSPECVKFYEKSLDINNRSYLTYNGLGNFYLKTNQFEKAEGYYTKAIEIDPKRSAKIYKNRAYLREKQNKNSDAKEDLKSYLKYFPQASDRGIIEQAIREL